jgi:hypothetical protein
MIWLLETGNDSEVRTVELHGSIDLGWSATFGGDFDGDGTADVYLQHPNGAHMIWLLGNGTVREVRTLAFAGSIDLGWSATFGGDFDGDGTADVYLRHPNGAHMIWLISAGTVSRVRTLVSAGSIDLGWSAMVAGDFDGDGTADVYLQHPNGTHMIWLLRDATIAQVRTLASAGAIDLRWTAACTGDIDRDGTADVYLHHPNGIHMLWHIVDGRVSHVTTLAEP